MSIFQLRHRQGQLVTRPAVSFWEGSKTGPGRRRKSSLATLRLQLEKTIEVLRSLFAHYGIPEEVVSDNGPQLASEELSQFLKQNGVKFTRVPPYHPASNGAAERSVQTAKTFLTKQVLEGKAN